MFHESMGYPVNTGTPFLFQTKSIGMIRNNNTEAFFSSGKGIPMFFTPRKGHALWVCEKIILASLRYFSVKTLPWLNMDLFTA